MSRRSLKIFDFCFTLVDCNTTNELLKYALASCGLSRRAWIIFVAAVARLIAFALPRRRLNEVWVTAAFTAMPGSDFRCLVEGFVDEVLIDKTNWELFKILKSLSGSDEALICTNTYQQVVECYIKKMDLDCACIGSRLSSSKHQLVFGLSTHVLKEGKLLIINREYGDVHINAFWTDDIVADRDVVSAADITYVVGTNGKVNDVIFPK